MRYKTLEEVTVKYGLTVDLDEKAQLAEWESRLKNLLEAKQKELPNARNPSLRHKIERECAEVKDAFRFVSQQNFLTKLRRCVDEDKQEIFEHILRFTRSSDFARTKQAFGLLLTSYPFREVRPIDRAA